MANDYVDDAMQRTEEALASALEELRQSRAKFKQASRSLTPAPPAPNPSAYVSEGEQEEMDEEE